MLAKRDPILENHLNKDSKGFKGTSPDIQNDLIVSVASFLREKINEEIKEATFLAVQCDETTDISSISQMSIIVHFCKKNGEVTERFLGFTDVSENKTSEILSQTILDTLQNIIGTDEMKQRLVCQTYDGAAVMSGHRSGVQARIKEICPQAIYIHCFAHQLNLVILKGTNIFKVNDFFSHLNSFHSFFSRSPKRLSLLKKMQNESDNRKKKIIEPSETRWAHKGRAVEAIECNFQILKKLFHAINQDTSLDSETRTLSKSLNRLLHDFDFVFLLIVYKEILDMTDTLSKVLQSKKLDVNICLSHVESCKKTLQALREEEKFSQFYDDATERLQNDGIPFKEKRIKRPRVWLNFECGFNASEDSNVSQSHKDTFRKLYYEVLDNVIGQMNGRFKDMHKLKFFELLDPKKYDSYSKCFPIGFLDNLMDSFPYFDKNKLKNELKCIYSVESHFKGKTPSELLSILHKNELDLDAYKETAKLCKLILSMPMSTASSERSFSTLKRIKTYLRNTMSQNRLEGLALISIESEALGKLMLTSQDQCYNAIINHFVSNKDRRIELRYK